jgi:hypothetical protein
MVGGVRAHPRDEAVVEYGMSALRGILKGSSLDAVGAHFARSAGCCGLQPSLALFP